MIGKYNPRVAEGYFRRRLSSTGALLIIGPKRCGKTTIAEQISSSTIHLQDPDRRDTYQYMAGVKPSSLLEGEKPRLIAEWQEAPRIWDAIRLDVDRNNSRGAYILTSSSIPGKEKDAERWHTGTGRISTVRLRTMSTYEVGRSDGDVSLEALFEGRTDFDAVSILSLDELAALVCRGGWPDAWKADDESALEVPRDYVDDIVNREVSVMDGIRRDPHITASVLGSLSEKLCTTADTSSIVSELKGRACRSTVLNRLDAFIGNEQTRFSLR